MPLAAVYPESFFLKMSGLFFGRLKALLGQNQRDFQNAAQWTLIACLYGCIFVPRLPVYLPGVAFPIDIRIEDVLIPVFVFLVLFRSCGHRSLSILPAIENRFLVFLIVCGLSILNGLFGGTIDKPLASFFCLLKWFEYFIFFAVCSRFFVLSTSSFYLKSFFAFGLALAMYGYFEHFFPFSKAVYPNYYRIYERAPFYGDANHVGGLLVFWMAFFTGCALKVKDTAKKCLLGAGILFVFFPVIWTYSRKSYLALAGCYFLSFLFASHRRQLLFISSLLIIAALLLPTRFSERMIDIKESFVSEDPFHTSWAGDIAVWKRSLFNFDKMFLLGSGWGSRHRRFYESQYVQVLSESGVAGFFLFLALLWKLGLTAYSARGQLPESENDGLRLGWIMAFLAILIHSLTCVSFTVVKMALPFWFLTALVLATLTKKAGGTGE